LILAIDIGNSIVHMALYESDNIVFIRKFPSNADMPLMFLKRLSNKIKQDKISAGIASVITGEAENWKNNVFKYVGIQPLLINSDLKLPVKLKIIRPESLGTDRICNAVAAYELFKRKENVIAVDFGTATTYDVVLSNGDYRGGIISPGIETSARALNYYTSKLPLLKSRDFTFPRKVVGNNTTDAIRSGVFYSALASFEGIIWKIEKEYKKKFKVVLTGGFSALIHSETALKTVIRKNLVLDGINLIVKYNEGY
jgi:type III pantothenate kinase